MLVVVASFSMSLWYSQFRMAAMDLGALEIQTNATPAIELLVAARGDLLEVGVAASEQLFGPPELRAEARAEAQAAYLQMRDELSAYSALPRVPGEAALAAYLTSDLDVLEAVLADLLNGDLDGDAARAGSVARVLAFERMSAARATLSERIELLVEMNAAEIARRTNEILAARERAQRSALILGLISVAAAIVATGLMLVSMRQQAALVAERRRFLEVKASELEAFAGRVAHDLKNPLAALLMQTDLAERRFGASPDVPEATRAQLRDTFAKLTRRLQAMNRLIDAFLEFARGAARPVPDAHADLRQAVAEVVGDVQPFAEQAGVTLRVDAVARADGAQQDEPLEVACSPGVLRSVLGNLVQNAVKYMDGGAERSVAVHVEPGATSVRVDVEDTGPGIPPEKAGSIFEPFVRATASQVQGMGLGLATVKRIVESHGGRVGVRSRPGRGSTFWFELPRRAPRATR